ncbi:MAG: hypothetical protein FJY97_04705 [candidate division Zixibacteria bacterium]|nr:hypothetical protein [candidate division Zixibacteria bacterium]
MKRIFSAAVSLALLAWVACGGPGTRFDVLIVNTLQSAEPIRVDLGGQQETLGLGESALFSSVTQGDRVITVEGTICSGTILDTVRVIGDTTIRFTVKPDSATGACLVQSSVTVVTAKPVAPTGGR